MFMSYGEIFHINNGAIYVLHKRYNLTDHFCIDEFDESNNFVVVDIKSKNNTSNNLTKLFSGKFNLFDNVKRVRRLLSRL